MAMAMMAYLSKGEENKNLPCLNQCLKEVPQLFFVGKGRSVREFQRQHPCQVTTNHKQRQRQHHFQEFHTDKTIETRP
jgi:hypothetical protein